MSSVPSVGRDIPVIITQLMGGMGNQMFQYGMARRLAQGRGARIQVDSSILRDHGPGRHPVNRDYDLGIFALEVEECTEGERKWFNPQGLSLMGKVLFHANRRLFGTGAYAEPHFHFDATLFAGGELPRYIAGLWQSYKYVEPIREVLLEDFAFRRGLSEEGEVLAVELRRPGAVCLNVRRGDYVDVPRNADLLGFVGMDYYRGAVADMNAMLGFEVRYFVFSDDMEWCRRELGWLPRNTVYVGHELAGEKFGEYLHLMSLAGNFIIPNSTFAWWAAWLSRAERKRVMVPSQWFRDRTIDARDLCPREWVRI